MNRKILAFCAAMLPGVLIAGPVNINSADADTLARELDGVGHARAQAIVAYRDEHGAFRSVDEVLNVSGIGPSVLERNRSNIRLDNAAD